MKAMLQTPNPFANKMKKRKTLPLGQLVEETRGSKVSHHLLETKIFAKVKNNQVVEAEPSELHFSGFEVGKIYKKTVKLINVHSEVIHVHVLSTQTKYFRTEYRQTSRLVPGLAHTLTVHFTPDEWRYFFDSVRIHCKGEQQLLINVHAYPVIDDLNIPSHINLSPVALGQSSTCVIPLSCSSPVDFEFEVHCLTSHEAFHIRPSAGIIPAKGKADVSVTFSPQQYGTAEITLQLLISQFNSKPFIFTLTASCSPSRTPREKEESAKAAKTLPTEEVIHVVASKPSNKLAPRMEKQTKIKIKADSHTQNKDADFSKHRLAKLLIQRQDRMSYRELREAMTRATSSHQTRQMKEAAFENQVRFTAQKANQFQWQVQLGDDLLSEEEKIQILRKQEAAVSEYTMKENMEIDVTQTLPRLSSHRVVRCAGKYPDRPPVFCVYGGSQLEVRWRVLRLFQQTVRKIILQNRMKKRLRRLRKLTSESARRHEEEKDKETHEKHQLLKMSLEKLQPFISPILPPTTHSQEHVVNKIEKVHVEPIQVNLTLNIPFFNLKVPQHYRLMGYQEAPVYDFKDYLGCKNQRRPLRTGAENELLPMAASPEPGSNKEDELQGEDGPERDLNSVFFFRTPRNVLNPLTAHPLRIFNPAPGVYAFRPTPFYLESDPDFHLCPLTRPDVCNNHVLGLQTNSTQRRFLDRKDVIKGTMVWKKFPCVALSAVSSVPAQSSSCNLNMCDPFSSLVLPLETPLPLKDLPDNIKDELSFADVVGTGVSLNPDMVLAEFPAHESSVKDVRESKKTLESSSKPQTDDLGSKVQARIQFLKSLSTNHHSSNNPKQ